MGEGLGYFDRELIFSIHEPVLHTSPLSTSRCGPALLPIYLMALGHLRLAPEVKQQHVVQARKRYEAKNADKRREDAHLRMQHTRAVIAKDLHAKTEHRRRGAEASARYRERRVASCKFSTAPHLNYRKRAEQLAEEWAARVKKRKAWCMCPSSLAFCFDIVICRQAGANEPRRKHQVLAKPAPKKTSVLAALPERLPHAALCQTHPSCGAPDCHTGTTGPS
ncbi:hypothetical protein DFH08DRAFT_808466 [Mycena albidolilacea]|uniref:Uncharacterized protein n=1 Tax=Mycena albidolilacea TaxID=1033008 RepID=A0AAD7A1K5_9AGAR|nr:hypothetical protein DFH08DRAFT_808466 [Mycena albidolilacea]